MNNSAAGEANGGDDLFDLYTVLDKIGDGGMGVVYLARDRRLGRFVAIKRLVSSARVSSSLRRRFLREARAVAALNHAHIVQVYAMGEDHDGPYMVMEYVPGPVRETNQALVDPGRPAPPCSLENKVSRQGQLAITEAMRLLVKVSQAVAYAHGKGVIHRDIKPSNILLDPAGEPKIVDFGLARLAREEEDKLTLPGEKLLSLGYGAPEQEKDAETTDERSDVYGLGALLYFAITGQNPRYFRDSDIPPPLRQVLSKALATDRQQRWPGAGAFADELVALLNRTRNEQQPTVKTTWRCKWCDTVNPLSLRYCGECGWDGGEHCAECGQPTFFGIQYCGECGADARAYEGMLTVSRRMARCMRQREFERVLSFAGRTLGFDPAGANGRALLKRLQQLREEAEKAIARRDQIRGRVAQEIKAQNYERVEDLIREYRSLRPDGGGFETEMADLPEAASRRDLERAQAACRQRDYARALRLCELNLSRNTPDGPRFARMVKVIARRRVFSAAVKWALVVVLLAMLYPVALPPLSRLYPERFAGDAPMSRWFAPAIGWYREGRLSPLLSRYAALWHSDLLAGGDLLDPGEEIAPAGDAGVEQLSIGMAEAASLVDNYQRQLEDIEERQDQSFAAWAAGYKEDLAGLMEEFQTGGDFPGWERVDQERERFAIEGIVSPEHVVGDPPVLGELQERQIELVRSMVNERARAVVLATDTVLARLQDILVRKTKAGDMPAASRINRKIRNIEESLIYLEARDLLEGW